MNSTYKRLILSIIALGAVAANAEDSKGKWKGSLALGSSYQRSTVSKSGYTSNLKGSYYADKVNWTGSIYGSYAETEGFQSDGQVRAKSDYRYKFLGDNKTYIGLYNEIYHNSIKNIEYRLRLGPSLGYYFIFKEALKLDASAGTTITYEKADGETKSFGSLRLAGTYDHKISDTTSCYVSVEYNMSFDDSSEDDGSLVTGIKTRITDSISLNLEFRDQYENISSGRDARKNDITITTGLSCNFG